MAEVHEREKTLEQEVVRTVETGLPGVEVLALELTGPEHFTVFVDHPQGVDHALCARVTDLLRGYLDRYAIDVSSPGRAFTVRTADETAFTIPYEAIVRSNLIDEG